MSIIRTLCSGIAQPRSRFPTMFLDEARIFVASGKGGDGIVHFRREKFVPRGGPDGGDGGRGGDVILVQSADLSTLSRFRRRRHFKAEHGKRGGPNNRHGGNGDDLLIPVPSGTIVIETENGAVLGELVAQGDRLVVGKGGRGGRGNSRFASSTNQAPRMAEKGEPGEERWINLELRLLADVGIVGVPNAGKSTLLAAVTRARPKVAEYPFTTLHPNLGVVELDHNSSMVLADIPGLIEGAHAGAGLGTSFLKHLSRTRSMIHLVDGASEDPMADFSQINAELALFGQELAIKPQVVAVNKMDLPEVAARWTGIEDTFKAKGVAPRAVSALAKDGLRELLLEAYQLAIEADDVAQPTIPVYRPAPDAWHFEVRRAVDGGWRIEGEGIERAAAMTYWEYEEAVRRFQRLLVKIGVNESLRAAGVKTGDTVRIGQHELEWEE